MARIGGTDGKRMSPRTRGRPSPDAAAQIDREILDAARELFFTQGYEGTSMAMIVKAAAVSKTTLYARYSDKAALFRATVRQTVDRIANQSLKPAERISQDLVEGLEGFGRHAIAISTSPFWANYERLVYAEGGRFDELTGVVAERIDIGVETVSLFIRDCAERDDQPCRDPDTVAAVYLMALRGFISAAILRSDIPREQDSEAFVLRLVQLLVASRADW